MASFRKILLCYDSTREGRRALRQGAKLAGDLGAETHLLAVAKTFAGGAMVELQSDMAVSEEERIVSEVLREGVEYLKGMGLKATGHLAFGHPIEQIPAVARDLGVDLIIVGHRTSGRMARWWAGPGNAQLLDQVDCCLLISIDPTDSVDGQESARA